MREAIKRIVHLDRYARIVKIADPPTAGSVCDRFRPYWAADIEILTPEGEPAKDFPKYEAVPLPVPMGGHDEGFFLWPRPGTIVTVRWIEGRPDHPVIQHVYPMGLSLPDVPDNMGRWQQRPGVHQYVDPAGTWERQTDKDIRDIAQNIQETAHADRTETTGSNATENVGESKKITAGDLFSVKATHIVLRSHAGVSLLPSITQGLAAIYTALKILADHTHESVGSPNESSSIHSEADSAGANNTAIKTLIG